MGHGRAARVLTPPPRHAPPPAPRSVHAAPQLARRRGWHHAASAGRFHEVYCLLFELLDAEFKLRGGTYMTFPTILSATRAKFSAVLSGSREGESLAVLRQRAEACFLHERHEHEHGPGAQPGRRLASTFEVRSTHFSVVDDTQACRCLASQPATRVDYRWRDAPWDRRPCYSPRITST
eukprot:COSAG01_NODE_5899_length_3964_cov_3.056404_3_plen_179_part_00